MSKSGNLYDLSVCDTANNGSCIKLGTGKKGMQPQIFLELDGAINPVLQHLYNVAVGSNNGNPIPDILTKRNLVTDDGFITPNGEKLVAYILGHDDPRLYSIRDEFYSNNSPILKSADYQDVSNPVELITVVDTSTNQSPVGNDSDTQITPELYDARLSKIEIDVLNKISQLEEKMIVYHCGYIASQIYYGNSRKKVSKSKVLTVKNAVRDLKNKGLVEIYKTSESLNQYKRACKITDAGKLSIQTGMDKTSSEVNEAKQQPNNIPQKPVGSTENLYDFQDDILKEFDKLKSSEIPEFKNDNGEPIDVLSNILIDNTGTERPVLYSEQHTLEGFDGAIYVKIGETAYRVGMVTAKKELIPSPETVYAQFVAINNKNTVGTRSRNETLTEVFIDKLKIGESESKPLASKLDEVYRNTISTSNRNLTDSGKLFLTASEQLFSEKEQELVLYDSDLNFVNITPKTNIYSVVNNLVVDKFSAKDKKENPNRHEKDKGQKQRTVFKARSRNAKKRRVF
ncbi:hypothetical protein GQ473_00880 [archaeon]|nr:hypothetical protein [archaeon]